MLSERILGALYVPSDIQTPATKPAEAMARVGDVRRSVVSRAASRLRASRSLIDSIQGVETTHGDIATDLVVSAVGIWGPKIGKLANVPIPLSPMQHIYAVTEPLPELEDATSDIAMPLVRHQDRSMYFRQERESFGIAPYLHEPLIMSTPRRF